MALALLLPIMLVLLDLWVKGTDAYGRAARFVIQDARVADLTGKVNRIDFLFWHGFSYIGDDADFTFQAISGKSAYIVDVDLRHIVGKWRVREVDISPLDGGDTLLILR